MLRSKGKIRNWGEKSTLELQTKALSGVLLVPGIIEDHAEWEKIAKEHQQKLLGGGEDDNGYEEHDHDSRDTGGEDDSDTFDVEDETPENFKPDFEIPEFDKGPI